MTEKHDPDLFSMFSVPAPDEWWAMVRKELESDDPQSQLAWQTREGISVKPLYMHDGTAEPPHGTNFPGEAPFLRGIDSLGYLASPWRIRHQLSCHEEFPETEIVRAEESGRGEIEILVDAQRGSLENFYGLLDRTEGSNTPVVLNAGAGSPAYYAAAVSRSEKKKRVFSGSVAYDPLSSLAETGMIPGGVNDALRLAADCVRFSHDRAPAPRTIVAGGHVFHNAGATCTQELAYTLAAGIEYVHALASRGISVDEACASIEFSFSIGTNFWFEVAKLRAARMLWTKIVHHFSPAGADAEKMRMHARTSSWMLTRYDPHVNILRATIGTMAAAFGGANAITTLPFDAVPGPSSEMSRRLARNTSLLLAEESGIAQVIDPAGGSKYLEALTDESGRAAWSLLQEVEARGGFLRSLENGAIQSAVQRAAGERDKRIADRREVFIGTNRYPNLHEASQNRGGNADALTVSLNVLALPVSDEGVNSIRAMAEMFGDGKDISDVFMPTHENAKHLDPLRAYRGAEGFERLRAAVERQTHTPKVLLATLGLSERRRARATFSAGFLGVAGFDIIDHPGYATVDEAVSAAMEEAVDIVVACSDDKSYPVVAAELARKIKKQKSDTLVLVAGYPEDAMKALNEAGVDGYIHLRANALTVLEFLLSRMGIVPEEVSR